MDVSRHFHRIRHATAMELLARHTKERRLLRLFEQLLASYCTEPGRGLPIGNLTSGYLAHLYLDRFDHYSRERAHLRGYVRHMDGDMNEMLACGGRAQLLALCAGVVQCLREQRRLTLKQAGGYLTRAAHAVEFLSFRPFPARVRKLRQRDAALAGGRLEGVAYQ